MTVDAQAPSFEIISTVAAPTGWKACYLLDYDPTDKQAKFLVLPIILWATVSYDETRQAIRPVVAWTSGEIGDYEDSEHPFVCLVQPGDDPERVAQAVIESDTTMVVVQSPSSELPS